MLYISKRSRSNRKNRSLLVAYYSAGHCRLLVTAGFSLLGYSLLAAQNECSLLGGGPLGFSVGLLSIGLLLTIGLLTIGSLMPAFGSGATKGDSKDRISCYAEGRARCKTGGSRPLIPRPLTLTLIKQRLKLRDIHYCSLPTHYPRIIHSLSFTICSLPPHHQLTTCSLFPVRQRKIPLQPQSWMTN